MGVDYKTKQQFLKILEDQRITSVYQPIVSLENGEIYGYEALSRINLEHCTFETEEMFRIAEELKKVWELEELCRMLSLKNAIHKPIDKKLFLNVDTNILHDEEFRKGITYQRLMEYHLNYRDIVFEITERTAVEDVKTFTKSVEHYKNQGYQIAIDDVGSGYSGLNRVCQVSPNFIKIDMNLVRNIDKDPMKKSLVSSFGRFCKDSGIKLIAEGIETEEELRTIIGLGVSFGQGYFIKRPSRDLDDIDDRIKTLIQMINENNKKQCYQPSFFGNVEMICKPKDIVSPTTQGGDIFDFIKHDTSVTEVCVVDDNEQVLGILTRVAMLESFGGRFGYNLNTKRSASYLMDTNFLVVDAKTSIEEVSKMALKRPIEKLYDAVVVTKYDKYFGVVTVKELLEAAITIQVTRAEEANPLTGLPGNVAIEKNVRECLDSDQPYSIIYVDMDNFKAYNDAYGFNNGDLMIKLLSESIELNCKLGEFKGHIGGDDFVIIAKYWGVKKLCQGIVEGFKGSVKNLYSYQDWDNGYIVSKNRNGFEDKFPTATLSISVVTNQEKKINNIDEFSKEIAVIKKICKRKEGNSIVLV